ncbi:MAG: DUF4249 family protein [Bacteroidales bacterium]|nr:DUF4249 family protein [Bacteroidales bacterium]
MKNTIYKLSIVGVVMILIAGCTEAIDFNGKETDPYAVLISNNYPDSAVKLHLSWSRFFLKDNDEPYKTIDNANIQLMQNGLMVSQTSVENGDYFFDCIPAEGDSLSVSVNIPGYERGILSATTVIPHYTDIEIISCTVNESVDTYGNDVKKYTLKFSINDPVGDNYYKMQLKYSTYNDSTQFFWCSFNCTDPMIVESNDIISTIEGSDDSYQYIYFKDSYFEGQSHIVTIESTFYNTYSPVFNPYIFQLVFSSLNTPTFKYYKSIETLSNSSSLSFFNEPVQVICNIENGIGLFGGMATNLFYIKP